MERRKGEVKERLKRKKYNFSDSLKEKKQREKKYFKNERRKKGERISEKKERTFKKKEQKKFLGKHKMLHRELKKRGAHFSFFLICKFPF